MEYRTLGLTGLKVSALCLGTMQFGWTADETTAQRVLSAAYDAGINFIDTADIYSRWANGNPGRSGRANRRALDDRRAHPARQDHHRDESAR